MHTFSSSFSPLQTTTLNSFITYLYILIVVQNQRGAVKQKNALLYYYFHCLLNNEIYLLILLQGNYNIFHNSLKMKPAVLGH